MKKKLLAATLAAATVMTSLTGCGSTEAPAPETPAGSPFRRRAP